jgi:hypothetical protein
MSVLRRYCVGAFVLLCGGALQAQEVPSGQPITLQEVLIDEVDGQGWLRFRFVAPQIARSSDDLAYDVVTADIEHLCASFAIPYMDEFDLRNEMIVISLADQETEFGVPNPDATQFFEAFGVQNQTCIWEAF